MSEYMAEKYAPSLTQDDALRMFKELAERLGSISRAAEDCGIERRTYYKMEDREYVQESTKQKILHVALETSQDETLRFLLKRHVDDSLELLTVNLTTLYEEAVEETDRETIVKILEDFSRLNHEYKGLIKDNLETEVRDLVAHLIDKAKIVEITWTPPKNTLYRVEELSALIPMIGRELARGRTAKVISERFRVSEELVDVLKAQTAKTSRKILEEYEGLTYGYSTALDYWEGLLENRDSSASMGNIRLYKSPEKGGGHQTPSSGATIALTGDGYP